jgi:hypothetical protein
MQMSLLPAIAQDFSLGIALDCAAGLSVNEWPTFLYPGNGSQWERCMSYVICPAAQGKVLQCSRFHTADEIVYFYSLLPRSRAIVESYM